MLKKPKNSPPIPPIHCCLCCLCCLSPFDLMALRNSDGSPPASKAHPAEGPKGPKGPKVSCQRLQPCHGSSRASAARAAAEVIFSFSVDRFGSRGWTCLGPCASSRWWASTGPGGGPVRRRGACEALFTEERRNLGVTTCGAKEVFLGAQEFQPLLWGILEW